VREHRFASAQLFGAVCPERDTGVALVLPEVSTAAMNLFLGELARAEPSGTHAVLVLDRAGWHVSADLAVPANLTLVHLPTYSPWLDPIEMLWRHFRREVTHCELFDSVDALLRATAAFFDRCNRTPGRVHSIIGAHPA
jgi:transposase